ncbi:MAG: hypothetical protein II320_00670, partial [Oscillospiraceae bacterium]|nr:hypothetical protein [Oscillospiraceae bacterium]
MRFLGTGAADMLPDPFCDCPLCRDARDHPEHVRLRSHFLLDQETLIDFGPDLGASCARDRISLTDLRQVFVTHTHQDHFCFANAGLLQMSRTRTEPLDIFLSEGALKGLEAVFSPGGEMNPGMGKAARHIRDHIRFHSVRAGEPFRTGPYTVTAVDTTHKVSELECAVNYLFVHDSGKKLLYACDTGYYQEAALATLEGARIDVLVMEATFGSNRESNTTSHLNAWAFRDMLQV